MGASVLIIDAEEEFANQLATVLRRQGADAQITADGKAGLDAARINIPEAIVLCVELPRMSGYSICAKLKKDPSLKSVPLVITSAEATQETFDHHKKLKTRAEEYLKKPFDPVALVEVLSRHISFGAPGELPEVPITEELAVEAEAPLTISDQEAFGSEAPFDGVAAPTTTPPPLPELDAPLDLSSGVGLLDDPDLEDLDDEARTMVGTMPIMAQVQSLEAQVRDLEAALETARAERDDAISKSSLPAESTASQMPTAASGREVLALKKELNAKEREILELKDDLQHKSKELLGTKDEQMELEGRVLAAQEELEGAQQAKAGLERELAEARGRVDELSRRLEEAEARVGQAEGRASELEGAITAKTEEAEALATELNERISELTARAEQLDRDVEAHTSRITDLEQQLSDKSRDAERLTADLETRVSEVDSLTGQTRALGSELTRLTNELNAAAAESDSLREQLAATQAEVGKHEERAQALDHEREAAVTALEQTRATLAAAQEDLEHAAMREARSQEVRAKAKQALQIAAALLSDGESEGPPELEDIPMEEPDIEVDSAQIESEEAMS